MAASARILNHARSLGGTALRFAAAAALVLFAAWSELAVWFQAPLSSGLRLAVASLFAFVFLATAFSILARRALQWTWPAAFLFAAVLILWWSGIQPRQDRDWRPDVSRRSVITIRGNDVEVRNVRTFDWITAETAQESWEDRLYSLSDLRSLDLFTSTWGNEDIAHMMLSFGFASGPPLAVSLEIRRERDEDYSPIAGFFKKYELALIAADERDIIKVRTNRRNETVRRYRIDAKPENIAKLLAQYAELSADLDRAPRFYHTVWTNCTTTVYTMLRKIGAAEFPLDYRVLVSGRIPEYLYRIGFLDVTQPFAEIRRRSDITLAAKLAETATDFSGAIRR